jgi:hypothetical protein
MLDAWGAALLLSTMMALVPLDSLTVKITSESVLDITQPAGPTQFAVRPQKKKSVPVAPIFGLKNSVMGEHRDVVDGRSWEEEEGFVFHNPARKSEEVSPGSNVCRSRTA